MSEINPYQPPQISRESESNSRILTFDGQISEADYVAMMPERVVLLWLLRIVMALLVPIVILFAFMSVASFVRGGLGWDTILSALGALFIVGVCIASVRTMGAKSRGRRTLRRHPGLLCIARGRLSDHGMVIYEGASTIWLAPSELVDANVTPRGIRIPIDQNPFRYLALAARLFDQFTVASAKKLKQSWSNQAALASEDDWRANPFDAQVGLPWSSEADSDSSKIPFAGDVTAQFPLKSPELLARGRVELLSLVFLALAAVVALLLGNPIIALVCFGFAAVGVYNSLQYWRRYQHGTRVEKWNQAGWVSPDTFAWRNAKRAVLLKTNQIIQADVTDQLVTLYGPSGELFLIPRDHVADDEGWEAIASQFASVE